MTKNDNHPSQGIPLCVPEIRGNEWPYIKQCLDTNWVSSVGSFVSRFEQEIAAAVGSPHAVATASGTAALHVALLAAGIQPGDEVLVSTLTFIAPANAVRYVGAQPVFIDAEPTYWQMNPEKLTSFIEKECRWKEGRLYNRKTSRPITAIIPVHILGHPVDMDPVMELAKKYNLTVIEDATESLGASYKGRPLGSKGDAGCFSFNGNKIITTGGGGMMVSSHRAQAEKVKYLTEQAKNDPVEYIHNEIGYNYRMTNIQAAMGCAQLEQLPDYIAAKRRIAAEYQRAFSAVPGITCMAEAPWAKSIFWMYTVLVNEQVYGMSSRTLLRQLHKSGIQTRPLWQPLHSSPVYSNSPATDCTVSESLYESALSLPCSVGLPPDDQAVVIEQIIAHAA